MKNKEEINTCTTNKLLLDIHSLIHESCVTIEYEKNIEKCKEFLLEADMLLHELIERDAKNKILSEPDSTKYKDAEIIKGLLKWYRVG